MRHRKVGDLPSTLNTRTAPGRLGSGWRAVGWCSTRHPAEWLAFVLHEKSAMNSMRSLRRRSSGDNSVPVRAGGRRGGRERPQGGRPSSRTVRWAVCAASQIPAKPSPAASRPCTFLNSSTTFVSPKCGVPVESITSVMSGSAREAFDQTARRSPSTWSSTKSVPDADPVSRSSFQGFRAARVTWS